ncbi:MAG: acyl transferase [Saprospiraceae bacterium]|nr:acyl transferase [Saprospiraceae bacterium]
MQEKERSEIISNLHNFINKPTGSGFNKLALEVYIYQYHYNLIYREYCDYLNRNLENVDVIEQIPFLPIGIFKTQKVVTGDWNEEQIFLSSATTGMVRSAHFIKDVHSYHTNTVRIWEQFYDKPESYCFLALLPGYLERDGSSLISMVHHFIHLSAFAESGFFLNEYQQLFERLKWCRENKIPTILLGVSFALLDFINNFQIDFPELIVIETGGMKGKSKEISRELLHQKMSSAFGVTNVHSEYGMTELLSQAYSQGNGIFTPGNTMQVFTHQINDPITFEKIGRAGQVSVIDLMNIDSCAFIQTEDIGIKLNDKDFRILGRLDNSDLRGCNLLLEQ